MQIAFKESVLEPESCHTDKDLVLQAAAGDKGAFEVLYRRHVGRVYAICLRIIAEKGRAEELTQEVFIHVWKVIGSFRGESAFSSWLHRVAVNIVLVDLRTERRRLSRIEPADDITLHESEGVSPGVGERLDLEDAIAGLPPQARAIFVLHDIEGYRHEEIGERMGLATGTCKAQLHRARRLLREALGR